MVRDVTMKGWISAGGGATGSFARSIALAADAAGVPSSPDPAHLGEARPAADGTAYSRVIVRDGDGFLLAAGVQAVAVQAAIPVVPALVDAFRATPLDAGDWALVLGVALAPSVVAHALRLTGRIAVA